MNYPRVSVVVPVRKGGSAKIALDSLKRIDYPQELIEVFVIEGDNPSLQRNEGIRKACDEIVLFLDDDSEVDPGLLKETMAVYQDYPDASGVGGPACLKGSTYFQQATIVILTSFLGVYRMRARYKPVGSVRYTNEDELISCNLSVRKGIFSKGPAFNGALYPNEENELIYRMQKKGCKFIYSPKCRVYRATDENLGSFLRRIFSYGRGRINQLFVMPSWASLIKLLPILFVIYIFVLAFIRHPYFVVPLLWYIAIILFFSVYNSGFRFKIMPIILGLYLATHLTYAVGEFFGIAVNLLSRMKNAKTS